jgi:hypothetical protein
MVFTIDDEFESTGSVSTGVFQMLFAGSTGQPPIICCADAGEAANVTQTTIDIDRATLQAAAGFCMMPAMLADGFFRFADVWLMAEVCLWPEAYNPSSHAVP